MSVVILEARDHIGSALLLPLEETCRNLIFNCLARRHRLYFVGATIKLLLVKVHEGDFGT